MPIISITFSPPSQQSSEMACATKLQAQIQSLHQSGSCANPNFRLHRPKPELRSFACFMYEQQVNLLVRYIGEGSVIWTT